jgi:hypothetical protein
LNNKIKYYLFYFTKASSGLILLIRLLISRLDIQAITRERPNIGSSDKTLKLKEKLIESALLISIFIITDITTNSMLAKTKEMTH